MYFLAWGLSREESIDICGAERKMAHRLLVFKVWKFDSYPPFSYV